ncbi:MAG: ABC transporter ATP-binding protein [Acholeplasmatales bacterium]|nr:ABC transporter ATP-binding protein [Acholeplasmatales bacterium]
MKRKTNIKPYTKQFYKKNILNFIVAFSEVLLVTAGMLTISWLLQQVTDLIAGKNSNFDLPQLSIVAGVLFVGCMLSYLISYGSKPRFITKGISQYKEYIFEKVTKKNISAFVGENSSKYISSLTNDIQSIEKGYLWNIFDIMSNIILFIGALVMMFIYSPLLTVIALGLTTLPIICTIFIGGKMAKAEKTVSDQNEVYTATIKDTLSGFSVIKAFKVEFEMIKNFKDNIKRLANAQSKKYKMQILMEMAGTGASLIVQMGIFLIGAYLATTGQGVTAGTTIVFVQLLNYVLNPIQVVPKALAERKAAKGLIEKIAKELDQNVREEKEATLDKLSTGISVKDLKFGYTEDKEILHGISCEFKLGKKYAIVGTSGSGKSTLLNLLMASNDNYQGSISYDGTEIKDLNSNNLYEIESIIQQTVFIFNTTIKNNITMFQDFAEEDIEKAIDMSGLRTLVNEKGLDYLCGENGSGLSGGEKQRISIARCLLRKSQVLLVDEATAALDAETAYQVSNSILNLEDVTSIVVTHSLEEGLLKQYDEIITLKNGSIIEKGTFDNLINNKGYFYSLFTVSQ